MAEKQYKVGYFEDPNPVDSYVECDGEYLNASDVVGILKELQEENEQLKKDNEHLETCFKMADSTYTILQKQYWNIEIALSKCRKENENLKKALWDAETRYIEKRI